MAVRTAAKQSKTLLDMNTALTRAMTAAVILSQMDPDRRSSQPIPTAQRNKLRAAATTYRQNTARLRQLFGSKFAKYDTAVAARISEIFTPTGKRGRPKGSKNGRKRGRKSTAK